MTRASVSAITGNVATALGVIVTRAGPAHAHGFGQRYDLPVPLWLWMSGAALAVACSFVVIALVRREPGEARRPGRLNLLEWRIGRLAADPRTRAVVRALSVALLVLIVTAGLAGNQNPTRNLAPTAIWIVWWVGVAYVSALVGNVWAVINPWAALFSWGDRVVRRVHGGPLASGLRYPSWLGVWPAVVLFLAFAWVELVFTGRAVPAQLASITIGYSLITWTGMLVFGRDVWLSRGDPFAVAFGVLARFSPMEIRVIAPDRCRASRPGSGDDECRGVDGDDLFDRAAPSGRQWNVRFFGAGLYATRDVSFSMMVFVLLLLSTVTFDGFTATPAWAALESGLYDALAPLGGTRLTAISTAGLIAFPVLFVIVYTGFSHVMAAMTDGRLSSGTIARRFVLSLVPIAIAYHLAHYFTYLLIQGQLMIRLVSDPFGFGWDLFGTARYRPDIGVVGARFAWYTAVIAIVVGHIVAVYVAHVVAVREFSAPRMVLRSQLPMLVLMVGYTVVSLWIIAQPIVETGPAG